MFQEFNAPEYLKIDIANNFGLDKKNWDERIAWFENNEGNLSGLLAQADEPALFYAGTRAWSDYRSGDPSGYPVSLDATSSGLQLLAALTCDRKAASLCNVIDTGNREDAYTRVYEAMVEELGESAKIKRDDTKKAIMTSLYGSTAMPKEIFGEGRLLDVFYQMMQQMAPAAWELNQAFLMMWRPDVTMNSWILPDNFHVHVKIMDSVKERVHFLNKPYEVIRKVNQSMKEGRSLGANCIHSVDGYIVREMLRRCMYDPKRIAYLRALCASTTVVVGPKRAPETPNDMMLIKLWDHYLRTGMLSARIFDYLDACNSHMVDLTIVAELLDTLPAKPFTVVAVHDCFRCLPKYGNDLRRMYNQLLFEIARSELLSDLVTQIVGRNISLGKMDRTMIPEILVTNYALS